MTERMLVVIAASGSDRDLVSLAAASLGRMPRVDTLVLGGPQPHGAKLDQPKARVGGYAIAVAMDSDVVVFPGWAQWVRTTLRNPEIAACGAPRIDGAPGLHPSMLAMRADLFQKCPSFLPTVDGKDTGVAVSEWLETQGSLYPAPWERGDWWCYGESHAGPALWWHLGSGTASAWPGLLRYVYRRVRGLINQDYRERAGLWARRRRFIRAARAALG